MAEMAGGHYFCVYFLRHWIKMAEMADGDDGNKDEDDDSENVG